MKTDRFDEEFRRKLLGLPAEADPGEVERIQGFVKTSKPALPGFGWGKLLLYGGSSLLLIGSLSYNLIQNYRNTRLQSSIDSLAHQSVVQTIPSEVIRHDTVYITQSGKTERIESVSAPTIASETAGKESLGQARSSQSHKTRDMGSLVIERPKLSRSDHQTNPAQPETDSPQTTVKTHVPTKGNGATLPNQRTGQSNQLRTETDETVTPSPTNPLERSVTEKASPTNRNKEITKPTPDELETVDRAYSNAGLSPTTRSATRRRNKIRPTTPATDRNGQLTTDYSSKQNQRPISGPSTAGFTPANMENTRSNVAVSGLNRQSIPAEPLVSRQRIASTQLAIISPSHSLVVPTNELATKSTRRPWRLTMPTLSVPNAQYRIGGGLTGGNDQMGGALLGEIRLNHHWSVQAGLQFTYNQGFHYRDEQGFNEHQKEDFRQTYASQVPLSATIQDIQQMTRLVQVPIQVAYHYPFGRQWGLRLGLGTDLNLWERSTVSFDYRESNQSSEHELSPSKDHFHTVNNLILSTAIERSWKKWLFRAGPFISPQLQPVGDKVDNISWGANLQILYRLGK